MRRSIAKNLRRLLAGNNCGSPENIGGVPLRAHALQILTVVHTSLAIYGL